MILPHNPTRDILEERGILLPEVPLDLSGIFQSCGIRQTYIIAITGRSGSTWLASMLKKIPNAGHPQEYFSNEGLRYFGKADAGAPLEALVHSIVERHKTGDVFGFKIDPMRLLWLRPFIDLERSFPPTRTSWIDQRRINILKQAYSFATAKRTGNWHSFSKDTAQEATAPINFEDSEIWQNVFLILQNECTLEELYKNSGISPLRLSYEELFDSKDQNLLRVLYQIDPEKEWSLPEQVEGETNRLNKQSQSEEQRRFLKKYQAEFRYIMEHRGTFSMSDFTGHFPHFQKEQA